MLHQPWKGGDWRSRERRRLAAWHGADLGLDMDVLETGLTSFVEDVDRLAELRVFVTVDQNLRVRIAVIKRFQPGEEFVAVNEVFVPRDGGFFSHRDRRGPGGIAGLAGECLREVHL